MKRPAFQFYPADWRKDVELQSCSMAAQGLWINAMCVAHECEPYGHLVINGKGMTAAQLGRQVGLNAKEAQALLDELLDAGVARKTDEGVIFSKRMVEDEDLRNRRADGGKAGSEHGMKGAEHGSKGGRPPKARGDKKPPSEPPSDGALKPPPSSSSSSSTSVKKSPQPPKGGEPAVGLKSWLEALKASGEKPVPESDPVFAYADRVGIPPEFLALAWRVFRHRYLEQHPAKRYRDWRRVFRNAVEGNWLKVWYLDPSSQQYGLTTVGQQAQRAHSERSAA